MSFANPAALGLLGLLAVPILIHLLAQGEYRVVSVGSLRWLQSQQQPRWSRLQLRDPWRLALRCGLVAAMVLALAQPEWSVGSSQTNTQVLVDPSADMAAAREAVREVRARAQSTGGTLAIRWLSPGFPKWDASPPDEGDVPLYDLLAAADDTLAPGPLVVLAQAQADRLGWRRPTLARAVDWVALPGTVPGAERASPGRSVAVVHDGRPEVAAWVAAAIDAWAAGGGRTGDEVALYALPDLPPTYTPDWVVWLGAGEPWPPAVAALLAGGATVLSDTPGEITASVVLDLAGDEQPLFDVVRPPDPGEVPAWRALTGEVVLVRGTSPRELRLLGTLREAHGGLLASGAFPSLLLSWFEDRWRAPLPVGLEVAPSQALPSVRNSAEAPPWRYPLAPYLLAFGLLLWGIDRSLQLRSSTAGADP